MKKLFYLLALLLLSFTFVVSCSEEKKDEPEVPETPPPPPPTTADSLQGTWVSYAGQIAGTSPVSGPYSFTTSNLIVLTRDSIKFFGDSVMHTWVPVTPNASFPHKIIKGKFSIASGILTNNIKWQKKWTLPPPGIPEINDSTINDNNVYKIYFATNLAHAPYSKDTLTLIMTGSTVITNNKYTNAMGLPTFTNTSAVNEPIITLKFKRKS